MERSKSNSLNAANQNALTLKKFFINPKWRDFTTSMLFGQGTEIVTSTWEYNGEPLDINLIVNGSVRVIYKGDVYKDVDKFPSELIERIKAKPVFWEFDDDNQDEQIAFVDECNWFEYVYGDGEGEVFEDTPSEQDPEKFLYDMTNIAKYAFNINTNVKVEYPVYVLEGYDKDHDAYEPYAYSNTLDELKEEALKFVPVLNSNELKRKCSDGHLEPIDTILISIEKTGESVWEFFTDSVAPTTKAKVRLSYAVELIVEGKDENAIQIWLANTTPDEALKLATRSGNVDYVYEDYSEEILYKVSDDTFVDYVIE